MASRNKPRIASASTVAASTRKKAATPAEAISAEILPAAHFDVPEGQVNLEVGLNELGLIVAEEVRNACRTSMDMLRTQIDAQDRAVADCRERLAGAVEREKARLFEELTQSDVAHRAQAAAAALTAFSGTFAEVQFKVKVDAAVFKAGTPAFALSTVVSMGDRKYPHEERHGSAAMPSEAMVELQAEFDGLVRGRDELVRKLQTLSNQLNDPGLDRRCTVAVTRKAMTNNDQTRDFLNEILASAGLAITSNEVREQLKLTAG